MSQSDNYHFTTLIKGTLASLLSCLWIQRLEFGHPLILIIPKTLKLSLKYKHNTHKRSLLSHYITFASPKPSSIFSFSSSQSQALIFSSPKLSLPSSYSISSLPFQAPKSLPWPQLFKELGGEFTLILGDLRASRGKARCCLELGVEVGISSLYLCDFFF